MPYNGKIPYMIVCPYNFSESFPTSISLTSKPCFVARNNLKIINNLPEGAKKTFGICVKHISFPEYSFGIKFIEWVHLMRILGASKIHIPVRLLHEDVRKVFNYFEDLGYIETSTFSEPSGVPDVKYSRTCQTLENNMINDCFYKVKNLYDYVLICDPDEVIMPLKDTDRTWHDILAHFKNEMGIKDSFMARQRIYPNVILNLNPEIEEYHYMLQHVWVIFQ